MSLILTYNEKEYETPPEGQYDGVCVDVVDLGEQPTQYGAKRMLYVAWQLDARDSEGDRYVVFKRYTQALSPKANLRKDLQRWRSRAFTEEELKSGFDIESLVGVNAKLLIVHNEKDNKVYANVDVIMPPENNDWFKLKPEEFERHVERQAREAAEKKNQAPTSAPKEAAAPAKNKQQAPAEPAAPVEEQTPF